MAIGVAALAGTLFVGGVAAYAAATAPGDPELVSVSWTGPNDAPGDRTPTTTARAPVVDTPSTASVSRAGGVQQTLDVAVLPGPLTVEPATESVSLSQVRPFGFGEPFYAGGVPITVLDARGSLVGWRATVSLQALPGLDARQLRAGRTVRRPHARPPWWRGTPTMSLRGAPRSCAGSGQPIPVFWAAPGGRRHLQRQRRPGAHRAGLDVLGQLTASLAVAVS